MIELDSNCRPHQSKCVDRKEPIGHKLNAVHVSMTLKVNYCVLAFGGDGHRRAITSSLEYTPEQHRPIDQRAFGGFAYIWQLCPRKICSGAAKIKEELNLLAHLYAPTSAQSTDEYPTHMSTHLEVAYGYAKSFRQCDPG